jgi:hypothetical protein
MTLLLNLASSIPDPRPPDGSTLSVQLKNSLNTITGPAIDGATINAWTFGFDGTSLTLAYDYNSTDTTSQPWVSFVFSSGLSQIDIAPSAVELGFNLIFAAGSSSILPPPAGPIAVQSVVFGTSPTSSAYTYNGLGFPYIQTNGVYGPTADTLLFLASSLEDGNASGWSVAVNPSPPSTNNTAITTGFSYASDAARAIQACTLLLNLSTSYTPAGSSFFVTLNFFKNNTVPIAVPLISSTSSGNWTLESSTSTTLKLTYDGNPLNSLPWIQILYNSAWTAYSSTVTGSTDIGYQVIATGGTAPAAACFGPRTLVLCEDMVRREVHSLGAGARVVALHPVTCAQEVVDVDVFWRPAKVTTVLQVAPGAWVTPDHVVGIKGKRNPVPLPDKACTVGGPFADCCWFAEDVEGCSEEEVLDVYHLCPVDFEKHRDHAVVIGAEEDITVVAELYRSFKARIMKSHKFIPKA